MATVHKMRPLALAWVRGCEFGGIRFRAKTPTDVEDCELLGFPGAVRAVIRM